MKMDAYLFQKQDISNNKDNCFQSNDILLTLKS